jgi:sucrose synthase
MFLLDKIIEDGNQGDFRDFLERLRGEGNAFLLRDQIIEKFQSFCSIGTGPATSRQLPDLTKLFELVQEIVFNDEYTYLVTRKRIGETSVYGIPRSANRSMLVSVEEYLKVRDAIILNRSKEECNGLVIDMNPFNNSPLIKDSRTIGKGIYFFLRYLSSQLFTNQEVFLTKLLDFLKVHQIEGTQLMLNSGVPSLKDLESRIKDALDFLENCPDETPFTEIAPTLSRIGFERGWGNNAGRTRSTLRLLNLILENPDHEVVGEFFSRIPMINKIAILSPHGWFAQENVLGRPDTGGQVVYILNQVKALEEELAGKIHDAGLDIEPSIIILTRLIPEAEGTKCNVRLEDVHETRYSKILRVPFRSHNRSITDRWISRFEIWPYLEEYAADAETEIVREMGGRPDLIIGNYSDGNLVAYLMSQSMGVTYCTIAHALEKAKYLYSDLYWKDREDQYHFSLQFTADLIAMSAANMTITSTYQEIAGTSSTIGQYESYCFYTMPGLYSVKGGANMFHPRFNIVPPGVDQDYFFPFHEKEKRSEDLGRTLTEYVFFGHSDETSRFQLDDPAKKPIYTIARLDHIKNITGLVEAFGKSRSLRETCNLIIVSGHVDREKSTDQEEQEQIDKMYSLVEQYHLEGSFRWLEMEGDKNRVGEIYRLMADRGGVFVQPALFEAFGLTVLEAMNSGLPTVATRYGGPLETIVHRENGCHINPNNHAEVEKVILPIVTGEGHEALWKKISEGGVTRIQEKYTWQLHTAELIKLAKIYGFWNFVSMEDSQPLKQYVSTLYQLLYRPMAARLLETHNAKRSPKLSTNTVLSGSE